MNTIKNKKISAKHKTKRGTSLRLVLNQKGFAWLKVLIAIGIVLAILGVIGYFFGSSYSIFSSRNVAKTDTNWSLDVPTKLVQQGQDNGTFAFSEGDKYSGMIFTVTVVSEDTIESTLKPVIKSAPVTENKLAVGEKAKLGYKYGVDMYADIEINGLKAIYTEKTLTVTDGKAQNVIQHSISLPCGENNKRICSVWAVSNDPEWTDVKAALTRSAESITLN